MSEVYDDETFMLDGGDFGGGGAFGGFGDGGFVAPIDSGLPGLGEPDYSFLSPDSTLNALAPEPNQYYSGTDPSGALVFNDNSTYQNPDGSTALPEVVVTASPSSPSGPVYTVGVDGAVAAGFGFAGGLGLYADTSTGGFPKVGMYATGGLALGEGAGAGLAFGEYSSPDVLFGNAASATVAPGIGGTVTVSDGGAGGNAGAGGAVGPSAGAGAWGSSTYTVPVDLSGVPSMIGNSYLANHHFLP